MEEVKPTRAGLVVWLYTAKYINKLKRYGLIHYVSKNMNYAIIYVNRNEKDSVSKAISKQHFVRRVEDSYKCELPKTFEGVLDQVTALTEKNKEDETAKLAF